jgi:hypothetical protein
MRYRRATDVTHEEAGERSVLLDGEGANMTTLNPVGSLIWRELDGERSSAELAETLHGQFGDIDQATLQTDIDAFLSQLADDGLVEPIDS